MTRKFFIFTPYIEKRGRLKAAPLNYLLTDEGYAFKELYEVEVPLQGTDRPSIEAGMRIALEDLMINLSGLSDSLENNGIKKALIQPQKYVSQYRLSSD